ncbi:MAG: ammonium transporter [Pirellulaceae bacterium]|jgi:Amt family ammonium transporter|nr:ammonium transporter [Pirellulaceae bacterium]
MHSSRFPSTLTALLLFGLICGASQIAFAQEATTATTAAAATAPAAAAEVAAEPVAVAKAEIDYTINTLVMFICAVLVFFMQAGFAMVEVGLNAAKNAVNILFKNLMDLSVGVLLFLFIGFGLMYPGADAAGEWFGFGGTMVTRDGTDGELASYSSSVDFLFQAAFAAAAATIVSGCVAGRMKFGAYLVYSAVLTGLIYPISGMWKWGGGALAEWGFADFAGSVVVHAVGGFAGLAGAIALGARLGRYSKEGKPQPMPGHNLPLAALGVFVLWIGWYGFNAGSQLTYSGAANAELTTSIAMMTTIAAAGGAVAAMLLGWALFRKPDLTMALNGALAGLVGITANCDQVSQLSALAIGGVAGLLVVLGIVALDKLRIDDPVGAFPVHGLCGVWGGIATGIFGTAIPEGMSRSGYVSVQALSTLIICVWAFSTMSVVFYSLKAVGLLRVSAEDEMAGLDISEHGMHAYPPQWIVDGFSGAPVATPAAKPVAAGKPATEGA